MTLIFVYRSCQPSRHVDHWISRKTVRDRGLLPTGNAGLQEIKWSLGRWRHVTLTGQTRDPSKPMLRAQLRYISKTTGDSI